LVACLYLGDLAIPIEVGLTAFLGPTDLASRASGAALEGVVELISMNVLHLLNLRELGVIDERPSALRPRAIEVELGQAPEQEEGQRGAQPHGVRHLSRECVNPCYSGLILDSPSPLG
jgi:hypothetical protein